MTAESRADRRWRMAVIAIAGLLVAIAVIGGLGIAINWTIHQTVEDAIAFDVELEDRGDDLRVAILEVRHYHRDLLLNNPDATRVDLWQARYAELIEEIDAMEAFLAERPPDAELPDVSDLRARAEAYYDEFATAVRDEIGSQEEFRAVAEDLLVPLQGMEQIAIELDQAGEVRAAASFREIDDASTTGIAVLVAVILGLGAMGAVLGYAVLRLVQDQRRLVAVEQAAVAKLAEASRAKTDFIADASHELRTPLTVLRGNAEVGLALDADCAHREILEEIVDESTRMSRLVDDLLFLARSDAKSVPLELQRVEVASFLSELAGRAEILARERGATLTTRIEVDGSATLDTRRVEQAVLVLVDNAAKYSPAGASVELWAATPDGALEIEVRDRGPGIPADQRAHIFERFYRVDGDDRGRVRGAGLGLSIAAAIVEGHGGAIAAEDRPGGGTVMSVRMPRVAVAT